MKSRPAINEPANVGTSTQSAQELMNARNFLLRRREDYETAYREFRWPTLDRFNWANA
jgi:acetyl-CoA synthetase